jgi:hypothetical protein
MMGKAEGGRGKAEQSNTKKNTRCSTASGYSTWRAPETNRCAVSNVERMLQAFDFYGDRSGWKSFLLWVLRPS